MYTGVFFTIEAVFYLILLLVVYFRKNIYKSKENKVYSMLVVIAFIEVSLELVLDYIGPLYQQIPIISYFVARLYCAFIELWLTCLICYVMFVISSMNKKEKYSNIIKSVFILLGITFSTLNFILPLNFMYNGNVAYTYGPSVNIVYISAFLYSLIGIVSLIYNKKKIKDKRFFPILLFLILGGIGSYIQYKNPGLLLAVPIHSFITFLMYFTIENPDMKILEEVHNAKVISDNANEEKTMFLYNMTSSLREITKDINYEADYIIDESSTKKPDLITINDSAREIKVSTGKFTTMTNEMLDVSHLDAASIKVYNDKYNIKLILKEIITIYKDKIKNKNLDFRTNIQSDLPEYLYGDALNLKNVLASLLDNSLKYTNKGYIELSVNYIKKNDIARLIISIEDSGIGIKSTELEKIFNKNKEELNKYNLKNNLYTARKLVTLMGGTIIASSTFGVGTIMKVVLDQKIDDQTNNNNYDKVLEKKKVLLVEDSSVTTKLITKYLKDSNVIIDTVELGSDALDKIRNHEKYDLILLEEDLKPLDAYTIIKKLNQIKNFNIKVVLLTKNTSLEYTDTYKDQGFTNVLVKPIDKEKLINVINGKDE